MNIAPAVVDDVAGASEARALAFLADLSQALAVSLDLRETVGEGLQRIADFMGAEAASLFLLDDDGHTLECRVCVGPIDITGLRIVVGQGVVGRAVADNANQLVTNAQDDPRVDHSIDRSIDFLTHSLLCSPLSTAKGPIGALEMVNKRDGSAFAFSDAEILRLIAAPISLAINNARLALKLVEQTRLRREFDLARRMQKSLLPKRRRDAFPLLGVNLPAHEISGDFYDYFDLPDGRIGFVIGDVSGKGLDAALLMMRAASLLRWVGKDGLAPRDWLARVNEELCQTSLDGRFVCALVGYVDREGARATIAGGGFPPALLHRDGVFTEYPSGGAPLGILPEMDFDEHLIEIGHGALYCFSDGMTDVRDSEQRTIGLAGVRELIARHAGASPESRLRGMISELKQLRLMDDTTMLLLEHARPHGQDVLLSQQFPARPEKMRELRAILRSVLDGAGVNGSLRDKLVLAVDEACCNIIRHAYGPDRTGDIEFRVINDEGNLEFRLRDFAPPVDPCCIKAGPLGECTAGGLGVALIDSVMDDWNVEALPDRSGNRLLMHKRYEAAHHPGEEEQ